MSKEDHGHAKHPRLLELEAMVGDARIDTLVVAVFTGVALGTTVVSVVGAPFSFTSAISFLLSCRLCAPA